MRGYSVTTYLPIHFVNIFLIIVTAYPRIHFDIHLRQHIKDIVCLLKVEKSMKGITVYPCIQLFQGYSFEVAGYSTVTPLFASFFLMKQ